MGRDAVPNSRPIANIPVGHNGYKIDMDDKYYPIRLEKSIPYLDQIIKDLRTAQGQPGYAYTGEIVIHKYLNLGQDANGIAIEGYRLSSMESYIKFLDGGRNIFDFSGKLLEMLQQTDVKDIKFKDIKLPYESFYVSFLDSEIPFRDKYLLDGAFIRIHNYEDDPLAKYTIWVVLCGYDKEAIQSKTEFGLQSKDLIFLSSSLTCENDNSTIEDALEFERRIMKDEFNEQHLDVQLEEYKLLIDHLKLVVNALLYLSIPDPDLTDILGNPTEPTRKNEELKKTEEQITPKTNLDNKLRHVKLVGYKITKRTDFKSGKKVRAHWRRGHWRNQKYGTVGNEIKRLIWIRPVVVGDGDDLITGKVYDT